MVKIIDEKIKDYTEAEINQLISDYQPFIVKVISELKHGYIDADSDELSIALMAFNEAINKYEPEKGKFLSFARLVIESRIRTYWTREGKNNYLELDETLLADRHQVDNKLKIEILTFEEILKDFNLDFDDLVDSSPKHRDSRDNAVRIGKKAAEDKEVVSIMYLKKRLPISLISRKQDVSKKILKRNKKFITAVIIVFKEEFEKIIEFIL